MDTSETYIKMCEKAKEIQGSYYEQQLESESYFGLVSTGRRRIWLPRQDQLQEMVREKYELDYHIVKRFWSWIDQPLPTPQLRDSAEQLWLAFVMKEKYGKTWNGKEWK